VSEDRLKKEDEGEELEATNKRKREKAKAMVS
jgi:hypothetical protein